ncbi:MAG: WD40 repeat domain-containing protein [Planctomycetaceae bacterium]|jgi:WD40 repeat protein|nr:WD40 repeat domain-containing protein [Planctomycetaceae bacterium]
MKKIIRLFFVFFCLILFVQFVVGAEAVTGSISTNETKTISEHNENINSVAISPDGKMLATGAADRFVILSELDSGKEMWRLQFRGVVSALAFTPDGKYLLAGCRDKNLIICDVKSGKESGKFNTFTRSITAIEISPNGKYVAAGFDNGVTLILEIATKKLYKELSNKVHSTTIFDIAFSSKSDRILIAAQDASVSIWSVNDGKWMYSFKGHKGPVKSVSFDYRNEKIISSSTDRNILVWKPSNNPKQDPKELILQRLLFHTAEVSFVCFAPDAETAYSASLDKKIVQWDLKTGKQICNINVGQVINRAAFSPMTAYHAVLVSGKRAIAVETEQLKFVAPKYPLPPDKNSFPRLPVVNRPVAQLNAYLDKNKIGTNSTPQEQKILPPKGNKSCFFVDSKFAVSVGADGTGVVWDVVANKLEYSFLYNVPFTAVAFSPVSAVIAAGAKDGAIILLNPKNGKILTTFRGHTAAITDLAFSSNGKRLASASEDRLFINWNMDVGQSEGVAIGHKGKLTGVVISPDMSKAITVSTDKTIRVWKSSNQSEIWNESKPKDKSSEFVSVAVKPDGEWFAAGCENKTIEIWQLNEKKLLKTLTGLGDVPVAIKVSPDGKYLVSGGKDGVLVVWNTKTWKPEKTFIQLPEHLERQLTASKKGWVRYLPQSINYEPIVSVAFSNDGKKIITSGGSQTYIWEF